MTDKDVAQKTLESHNDVFADILNVLVFQGRQVVSPEELSDASPVSMYKADGKLHPLEQDCIKYWQKAGIRYAMENQSGRERDMPLRIISYDGAGYREQILHANAMRRAGHREAVKNGQAGAKRKSSKPVHYYPVFSFVLNFGNTRWTQNLTLGDVLDFPEWLKADLTPYFNEYRIHVFDIAFLADEQVKSFRSDFRVVAEYFANNRVNPDYTPSPVIITLVDEVLILVTLNSCRRQIF